jgi:threonyl-tRNA synthetase
MRILQLHSDFIEYEPVKKETANAEKVDKKPVRYEDLLVILTCVEKGDDESIAKEAVSEVDKFAKNMKIKKVLIYPYAHLSSELADPDTALRIMKGMESQFSATGIETHRAPFGWAKRFTVSVKGHPLAEHSRRISKQKEEAVRSDKHAKIPDSSGPGKADERSLEEKKAVMFRQAKLDTSELPENDHRIIGHALDLYSFHDAAPGMPFFHNNGMIIINELLRFWKEEHRKAGYQEVRTPLILNRALWEISGHWDKYRENMYFTKIDDDDYAVKPMNCPGGILIFRSRMHSYRDLPIRVSELGNVHRHELSGVLSGLFRVRTFTQDDAHIYMREDQIKDEILGVITLITNFYKAFGFEYNLELSTRPEKSIGTDTQWEAAERGLKEALAASGIKYKLNPGDGAFYGPKIDFHVKDSQGRTWQCGTIQLDMTMPDKFDLNYAGEDNKPHRVVMIHRTIMGSIERFLGILVEHFSGKFPLWLSPVQVTVVPISEKNNKYAKHVAEELQKDGFRVECNLGVNTMDYKIRDAQVRKVPYMLVLGDREEKEKNISVRSRDGKIEFKVNLHDFSRRMQDNVSSRSMQLS